MIFDANAYLGHWPFRKMMYRTADEIVRLMDRVGIDRAVVSSFDTIFQKQYSEGNRDLLREAAAQAGRLVPFACVNPGFPGWERDLRIAVEELRMRGIVLYPNYHAYSLKEHSAGIVKALRPMESRLPVSIALRLEDQRRAHWLCRVPDVSLDEVAAFVNAAEGLPVILAGIRASEVRAFAQKARLADREVYFEISGMESLLSPLEAVVGWVGAERVLFGSYMPFKYPETALLKFRHSTLTDAQKSRILSGNLLGILGQQE